MNSNLIFKDAPKFLTIRFNSLNKYVQEIFLSSESLAKIKLRFKTKDSRIAEIKRIRRITDEASLVAFIFVIRKMFVEGSEAAKNAVDTFSELNVNGFRIGAKFFQGRNENVVQGELLAEKMLNSISDENTKALIKNSKFLYEILDNYKASI